MIKIDNLTFRYSDTDKPALQGINLEIQDGEFILITGPSGGGKSSLCRCLNGLIPHFYGGEIIGNVEVEGLDVLKNSTRDLATKVGMVFQDPENQLVAMDVEREVAFGLENLAFPLKLMVKRVEEALDTVGIAGLRHRTVNELSGGEKQRVAIASVLALYPKILVLDEPTSELDPKGAEEVLNVVERLNDELGITVILIEHRLDRVTQHVDRMIVLDNGMIIADGTPKSILSDGKVSEIGVEIPPIIKLVQGLKNRYISIENTPLSVKEGRAALAKVFQQRKFISPLANDDKTRLLNSTRRAEQSEESREPSPGMAIKRPYKGNHAQPLVDVKGLYHVYPGDFVALKNINLKINEGEFVAIMGRNASGKTTLVKHFNGLLKPTKGDIVVDGVNTKATSCAELAREIGYVFQNPNDHLFANSVEQEIAFTLKNLGVKSGKMEPMIDQALERFGLTEYRHRYSRSLSGGEKQRVALASILVAQPRIIILDEPTRGMEYKLKTKLMSFLDEYRKDGKVVILVTQDVETVAEYGDRVILLSEGRIVVDGTKREVLSQALLFSPQINRLAQSLTSYGVPSDVLTADEALVMMT
ncbi:MAG: energy-coupling factor transporter ATPase [Chloroflexota bacterium]|nr:energy-coupling factor transporter ATPase [Chloroflexota bacterium]